MTSESKDTVKHYQTSQGLQLSGDVVTNLQLQIDEHVSNFLNPHNVTALQVGAYDIQDFLDKHVAEAYGQDETATPADVFISILMQEKSIAYATITLTFEDSPAKNISMDNVFIDPSLTIKSISNEQGIARGFIETGTRVLSISKEYADIAGSSESFTASKNKFYNVAIAINRVDFREITATQNAIFSDAPVKIDAQLLGGGRNGSSATDVTGSRKGGNGGDGGKLITVTDISLERNIKIPLSIGSAGGTTSIGVLYTSASGTIAGTGGSGGYYASGGGFQKGGNGTSGALMWDGIDTESLVGGGGGGGALAESSDKPGPGTGGSPYGGNGGDGGNTGTTANGVSGRGFGGGGGGGGLYRYNGTQMAYGYGGAGGPGRIVFRFYY